MIGVWQREPGDVAITLKVLVMENRGAAKLQRCAITRISCIPIRMVVDARVLFKTRCRQLFEMPSDRN